MAKTEKSGFETAFRSHTCNELRKKDAGKKVKIVGWADTIRGHGKIGFVDLRDRYGKTQIVIKGALDLKPEYVIQVSGEVKERKEGTENKDMDTGEVEVLADEVKVLSECPPLPFEINDDKVGEEVGLKYRYLQLRGARMKENLMLRAKLYESIHEYMSDKGFAYIDTPILAKSTPEGARDYIVPSRVNKGNFYALPQSPQLFKQLLMISGFDRYYQLARCFRDEDLRADRQPEFTQLDIEMSFIEQDDLIRVMEGLIVKSFNDVLGVKVKIPFSRIPYDEAMKKYKTDSPDLRKDKENKEEFAFCWIVEFPSFEYNDEEKRWFAVHHPFTSPEDGADFEKPEKVKAKAYDLVLNGSEIGGGSIRIHDQNIQEKMFETLGIGKAEAREKFGFLLDALSFGGPPHGGIAFGLDRMAAIMSQSDSIRDVIAFPKNKAAQDVMLDAPSEVSARQLKEVGINKLDVKKTEKKK
jgi:aspartyl-tRNA synthetase